MRTRGEIYKFLVVEENSGGEKWSQLAAHSHVSTSSQIAAGPYPSDENDDGDDYCHLLDDYSPFRSMIIAHIP